MTPETIKNVRQQSGLTQSECAVVVAVTRRQWQRWEAGVVMMPPTAWEWFLLTIDAHPTHRLVTRG